MKKYRCLIDGYKYWKNGEVYSENLMGNTYTVGHFVEAIPSDWELVEELTFPRKMMVWDGNERSSTIRTVMGIIPNRSYPIIGTHTAWKHAKEAPSIEITVKINGKEAKLSDVSDETLQKLKEL
jgi:hypothetical protein